MDYLKIVIDGCFNENNREHLEKYFVREFKKAEKDFFEPVEFFGGCLKIIESWENYLQNQVFKRKNELYLMLNAAKSGSLHFDEKNLEGKTIEQKRNETIEYCEDELSNEKPDGIGSLTYYVHLLSVTKGLITGNLPYPELIQIKLAILKAYQKTQVKDTLPDEKVKDGKKLSFHQIALKLFYEGEPVTEENANDIISKYGWKSGKKLYQYFNFYSKRVNRKAIPDSKKKLENKIELFEFVIDLLPLEKKEQAKDELQILENHYKAEYQ